MAKAPLSEAQLMQRVRDRFSMDKGWATFSGVRSHRGFKPPKGQRTRTLDGMSVGTWQSLKGEVLGFECKSTRSDFLREVAEPDKSDAFFPHCNRFWVVVGDNSVASPDEVPMGWGLLVPRGEGLVEKVRAPRKKTDGLSHGIALSLIVASAQSKKDEFDAVRRDEREKVAARYESEAAMAEKLRGLRSKISTLERSIEYAQRGQELAESKAEELSEALKVATGMSHMHGTEIARACQLHQRMTDWSPGGLRSLQQLITLLGPVTETLKTVEGVLSGANDA